MVDVYLKQIKAQ